MMDAMADWLVAGLLYKMLKTWLIGEDLSRELFNTW